MVTDPHIAIEEAVAVLRSGGVVLHATEGVWGFACDPRQSAAVEKVIALKGRSSEKGLIVIGDCEEVFTAQMQELDDSHREAMRDSWPGPHTWIVPDREYLPLVRGFRDTLAVRVPGHAQARELCAAFGGPLVSTSANLAGEPAISNAADAYQAFAEKVDYVLPGEVLYPGRASTIHGRNGEILR